MSVPAQPAPVVAVAPPESAPPAPPNDHALNVPIGPSTIAGGGVSLVAFTLALIAALTGHGSGQDIDVIVAGATGLVTTAIVLLGRYSQAKVLAQKAAR